MRRTDEDTYGVLVGLSDRMADGGVLAVQMMRAGPRLRARTGMICRTGVNTDTTRLSLGAICLRIRSIRRAGESDIAIG
jgi:hypothetical protein